MKRTWIALLSAMLALSLSTAYAEGFDADRDITVISREDGSGTRSAFVELLGIEQKNADGVKIDMTTDEASVTNSTSVCMTSVASNRYAIGYISLGSLNDSVKALSIDGVAPSVETVASGAYPVARPFAVATSEHASVLARDFIAYILSAEGQAVVADNGYIAVSGAEAYSGGAVAGKLVVGGSSSVTPVMEKLAEAYALVNPNARLEVQQSDSTTGMNGVLDGVLDIGMASRVLKDSELEAGLVPTTIAMDGIAVIVNVENPLNDITSEQVRAIYTGEATAWDEVAAR